MSTAIPPQVTSIDFLLGRNSKRQFSTRKKMKLTVKDTETETARLRRYIYFEGMAIVALYFCVGMMLYQATAALYDESVHGIVGVEATKVEIPINQLNDRSLQ